MKKFFYLAAVMMLLAACGPKTPVATGIKLDKTAIELGMGSTTQLVATVQPVDVVKNVKWETSDASIVTVTQNGTIRGISIGTATITASQDKVSASCTVTVTDPYKDLQFTDWNFDTSSMTFTGATDPNNGDQIMTMWMYLLPNTVSIEGNNYVFQDGVNYIAWFFVVAGYTTDSKYRVIRSYDAVDIDDIPTDADFVPGTFLKGWLEDTVIYASFFEELYAEGNDIISETPTGLITGTKFTIDLDFTTYVGSVPFYNLNVDFLNGSSRTFAFGSENAPQLAPRLLTTPKNQFQPSFGNINFSRPSIKDVLKNKGLLKK